MTKLTRFISLAALVAVMVMVSFVTCDWQPIALSTLQRMPRSETGVMPITVAVVVIGRVLTASVISVRRVSFGFRGAVTVTARPLATSSTVSFTSHRATT